MVLDEDGYVHHRANTPGVIDLHQQAGQEIVKGWMREAAPGPVAAAAAISAGSSRRCTRCGRGGRAAADHACVTRWHDGCLLRSLLAVGGELSILEDAATGLAAATERNLVSSC